MANDPKTDAAAVETPAEATPDQAAHDCTDTPATDTPEVKAPAEVDHDAVLVDELTAWLGTALTGECVRAAHAILKWMGAKGLHVPE